MAALPATNVFEMEVGGSDTANAGMFDPGNANMSNGWAVASANTASPVLSHATVVPLAGDAGAFFFLKSGTNGIAGWYKIVSVDLIGNTWTLDATIGHATLSNYRLSTVRGCASSGTSLSTITGSIDFSQQTGSISLTGLSATASSTTVSTTAARLAWVGNGIQVTGGTHALTGFYTIVSVVAGTSFVTNATISDGNAVSGGTAGLGGALASYNFAAGPFVGGNVVFIQGGTYSVGQTWAPTFGTGSLVIGYATYRGDNPTGSTRPTIQATVNTITLFSLGTSLFTHVFYLIFDANGHTSINGPSYGTSRTAFINCKAMGCATGFGGGGAWIVINCEANACTTGFNGPSNYCYSSSAINCTTGFNGYLVALYCLASGGTTGFSSGTAGAMAFGCVAYNTSSHGFTESTHIVYINCIASNCGGAGFNLAAVSPSFTNPFLGCAGFSNTGGNVSTTNNFFSDKVVALGSSPFNAAGTDFGLNNIANGGALCRAAGIPGAFPGLSATIGYQDIGAVQHQDPLVAPIIGGHVARRV